MQSRVLFAARSTSNMIPLRLPSSSIGIVDISTSLRTLFAGLSTPNAMSASWRGLGRWRKAGRDRLGTCSIRPLGETAAQISGKERMMGGANWRSESRAHAPRQRAEGIGSTSSAPRQGRERRIGTRKCASFAATVDTEPHKLCFAAGALLRELHAVASVL